MPADSFNYIECWINRKEQLSRIRTCPIFHTVTEGSTVYFVRDKNNLFTSEEVIRLKSWRDKNELGWKVRKSIDMNKAISVIEYVIENLSFPNDVRFDTWHDLNRQIAENK